MLKVESIGPISKLRARSMLSEKVLLSLIDTILKLYLELAKKGTHGPMPPVERLGN